MLKITVWCFSLRFKFLPTNVAICLRAFNREFMTICFNMFVFFQNSESNGEWLRSPVSKRLDFAQTRYFSCLYLTFVSCYNVLFSDRLLTINCLHQRHFCGLHWVLLIIQTGIGNIFIINESSVVDCITF